MMTRHHVILTCGCIFLIFHRMPLVYSGTLSSSSLSSSGESSADPVIRIRTQGSKGVSDEDLEFSDTSHGEVTNSDQQVVYINHGGGAVSSIRRSFAVPFTPHVSSYPANLFEGSNGPGGNSDPDVGPEYRRELSDAGFARRAGASDVERPFDGSFDDHHVDPPESYAAEGVDPAPGPISHDEPVNPGHQPMHPAPLGLPVPPTSFGTRTGAVTPVVNNINHNNNNPVSHRLHDHRIAEPDQRNPRINFLSTPKPFNHNINPITGVNNVHHNNHPQNNNNINRINPLLNAFSPIASGFPQALNPDFFNLFDAPFGAPIGPAGFPGGVTGNHNNNNVNNDNLFQRRRLSIQNTPNNEISHNSLAPANGYPNYNYYAGNEENEVSAKWPKIFKFSDGRINLYEFEKDKKIGRIKFSKDEDPLFDGVRRDSFLILHGGTYS